VNPLQAPQSLITRPIEDIQAMSRSVQSLSRILGTIEPERVDAALDNLATLAEAAERLTEIESTLTDVERRVLARADSLEQRLGAVVELAERVERGLPSISKVLDGIQGLERQLVRALETVQRLESDITSLGRIGPSVDVLSTAAERLADTVGPLQGAAERLGRIADRLPLARGRTPEPS
jgi:methyl-accepting chemotaxis protein